MCNLIKVDKDKCVKCGICAKVCPSCIIEMGPEGPYAISELSCMSCGHCVSVCPHGALINSRCPYEETDPIPMATLDSKTAMNFLRMRRSIRNFKPDLVPEEKIRQLLDAARYAPTAANSQGLYYVVISDKEKIRQVADITAQWMEEEIAANSPRKRYFVKVLQIYRERKVDIIARNANQMIFALVRRLNTTGISNCEQAFAYAELFAPTIGLGTTIIGFVQTCAQENYQPLRDFLQVPIKQNVVGCMLVGYPKYKYQRLVDRQHLKVEFR